MSLDNDIIWRPVVGYEGRLEVSSTGLVRSVPGGRRKQYRVLTLRVINSGYYTIRIFSSSPHQPKRGVRQKRSGKGFLIHRLVADAFVPNPDGKLTVNHKDGDKLNNNYSNLEWATQGENNQHSINMGLRLQRGSQNHKAKLTEDQVIEIRRNYKPKVVTQASLAKQYGVGQPLIGMIVRGDIWRHLL